MTNVTHIRMTKTQAISASAALTWLLVLCWSHNLSEVQYLFKIIWVNNAHLFSLGPRNWSLHFSPVNEPDGLSTHKTGTQCILSFPLPSLSNSAYKADRCKIIFSYYRGWKSGWRALISSRLNIQDLFWPRTPSTPLKFTGTLLSIQSLV